MDLERYDRQIRIPKLGQRGQERLAASRVLVVGAGGLGSPVLLYLAAAGVGTLGVADGDGVTLSNLNRQVLHRTSDVGVAKVESAAQAIAKLNPEVTVHPIAERLDVARIEEIAADYDLIVDAADTFASKYALSDGAVRAGKPLVHGGVEGLIGQLGLLCLAGGPCLRCVFPEPGEEPAEPRPILGAAAGVIGSLQAVEALKYLGRMGDTVGNRLLVVNLWRLDLHAVTVDKSPECAACAGR
ncbi:MAG: HesA/MoeB/ThiF family protein [Deltaproteobacteria bacterium]|jgi:molybdopterin/thiamine biosynthesis adenylyltransferase|nr:HesA/MoeB/ThiF family protein [Deltaproteobacteria bacterium]MBW2535529.1 HesA/MoeB/ThiF family protein [Deltaproteobacteria bacterium]